MEISTIGIDLSKTTFLLSQIAKALIDNNDDEHVTVSTAHCAGR